MPTVKRAAIVSLLVVALLAVGGVIGFAASQIWATGGSGIDRDSMLDNGQMGSMMDAQGMAGSQMMGSFDENKPFDLQFINQMVKHHQVALTSSEHMISDSQRPELRTLYENIQKSQSEQIAQM